MLYERKMISKLKEQLDAVGSETIELPSDVLTAIETNRPQLLKLVNRPMTEAEVVAVMDVLAGEMRMMDTLKEIVRIQDILITTFTERFQQVGRIAEQCEMT